MAHGGARPGSGRKKSSGVTKTREAAERLTDDGLTPLDYLVGVMRGSREFDETKFEAAKAAAPYMHARLAAVEMNAHVHIDATSATDADLEAIALGRGRAAVAAPAGPNGPDRVH